MNTAFTSVKQSAVGFTQRINRYTLLLSILLFVPSAAWVFGVAVPRVQQACGATPLDMRAHYGSAEAATFIAECGSDGLAAYQGLQLADLVYPAVSAFFLGVSLLLLLRSLVGPSSPLLLVALLPVVSAIADYVENAMAWLLLSGVLSPLVGDVMGWAALTKTLFGWASGLALLVGFTWWSIRWVAVRLSMRGRLT